MIEIPECLSKDFKVEMPGENSELFIGFTRLDDPDIEIIVGERHVVFIGHDSTFIALSPEQIRALGVLQEIIKQRAKT